MVHRPSICTMSLGRCFAGHSLAHKLDMARKHGFRGIEVFHEDLVDLATSLHGNDSPESQLLAARSIRGLCDDRHLDIVCLQPLMHYGGLLDRGQHTRRLRELRLWIQLAHALGTDLILLPSSFLPRDTVTDDLGVLAADMVELAEAGLQERPVVRFAYEALCWGTRIDTWEASWDLVQRVGRPNFGLCLDTFNIAGRVFADPASSTGRTPRAEQAMVESLATLAATVDVSRVFLVQVADAERLGRRLDAEHPFYDVQQPPRMSWSRNCRLFYGETQHGAYLPVRDVLDAIVNGLGFQGWLSFEVFNRVLAETGGAVPEDMARRAALSWDRMVKDVPLQVDQFTHNRISALL